MGIEVFKKHLREKRAINITANTLNEIEIAKICKASQIGKASSVSIPSNKKLFEIARQNTKLPIFATSIHPFEILDAVRWGAEAIKIGGFNNSFTANEIYDIVLETLGLINDYNFYSCVEIPENIKIEEKIQLIKKLEILGVDLIQIKDSEENINKINENTILSIITTQDISSVNSSNLLNSIATNIINIDSIDSEVSMATTIMTIVQSLYHRNSINHEILRTQREMMFG